MIRTEKQGMRSLIEGPLQKKFRILAQYKEKELEKTYSKHFKDSTNKLQLLRLKKEFENVRRQKMQ